MSELAYSLHLGSDKNRKNVSKAKAKSNASGTTSLSNNAIQNARQLSLVLINIIIVSMMIMSI